MKTNMKLFIFEPYVWAYCGGAIGVVAMDFEEAVKLAKESEKNDDGGYDGDFQKIAEKLKKDHWDQWLLSAELTIMEEGPPNPRVLFNNYNHA